MNAILFAICALVGAEPFEFKFDAQPFEFRFTETATPGSGVEADGRLPPPEPASSNAAPDLSRFVHRISMRSGSRLVNGSGCLIGPDTIITCRHGFDRGWSVEIDGQQVAANVKWDATFDFATITTPVYGPPAQVSTSPPVAGSAVSIFGTVTGLHSGTITDTHWGSRKLSAICDSPIDHGDSGGGVFDSDGRLIGIVNSKDDSTGNEIFFTPLSAVASLLSASAGADRPSLTFHTAPFACGPCNTMQGYDWSGFDVARVMGGATNGYPEVSWTDPRGVKRVLTGLHTPSQVRWSMDQTGVAQAEPISADAAAAAPTPYSAIASVFEAIKLRPDQSVDDLGCGDGRALIVAVEQFGVHRAVGVEIDPARAAAARERVQQAGLSDRIEIITGDSTTMDLQGDVVFVYLYDQTLQALASKLDRYATVISYMHPIRGLYKPMRKVGKFYVYGPTQDARQPSSSRDTGDAAVTAKASPVPGATTTQYQWQQVYVAPWATGGRCGNRSCVMCYGGMQWKQVPVQVALQSSACGQSGCSGQGCTGSGCARRGCSGCSR